jgi:hypothetical protein
MSIFVSNDIFSFEFKCKKVFANNGSFSNYKVSNDGDVKITCRYVGRSFSKMSKVIEDSSIINSVTGKPLLRTSILCKLVVSNFIKTIIIDDGNSEETIDVSNENINYMQYDIVKEITKKWLEMTSGK